MNKKLNTIVLAIIAVSFLAIPLSLSAGEIDSNAGYPNYANYPNDQDPVDMLPVSGDGQTLGINPGYPQYALGPDEQTDFFDSLSSPTDNSNIDYNAGYPKYATEQCAVAPVTATNC